MSSHDDHAIEPQPTLGTMDIIWMCIALGAATFAFCFICFNAAFMDFGKHVWPYLGWVV